MRAHICATALALVLAASIAGAQEQTPSAQPSPQNGQTPAAAEQKADEAARQRQEEVPHNAATAKDARGGQGNPTPDQTVGPPNAGPVPLRGEGLDIPGATAQTAPAKYSSQNARLDEGSIMGRPVQLSDEQRQAVWSALGSKSETVSAMKETVHAEPGVFLPPQVQAEELPAALNQQIPVLRGLKYVKADDRILLVAPANGIVRGVIAESE